MIISTFQSRLFLIAMIAIAGALPARAEEVDPQVIKTFAADMAVSTDKADYGIHVDENVDRAAIRFSDSLKSMTNAHWKTICDDEALTNDARFLLVLLWIRSHSDVDSELLETLGANFIKIIPEGPHFPIVSNGASLINAETESYRHRVTLRMYEVVGEGISPHRLILSSSRELETPKPAKSSRAWWLVDPSVSTGGNAVAVQQIERGWNPVMRASDAERHVDSP